MRPKLLLATNNPGKAREYRRLLSDVPFKLVSQLEMGLTNQVDETGQTLEENARLKAVIMTTMSGLPTLADDSGLEVDALGGEPGHLSARYAGENATDEERIRFLLSRLKDVPWERRTARFCCIIALATPEEHVEMCSGECRGIIAFEPKGKHGFGYDAVFYLPKLGKTMAELSSSVKNRISHRAQAAQKAIKILNKPPFSPPARNDQ
ncbi:MAG: XTP/dITP diphosphatase [Chloroflexi bacterium]|nr:XTP/dITP diphosphatase [Chloroflexota bacterium]